MRLTEQERRDYASKLYGEPAPPEVGLVLTPQEFDGFTEAEIQHARELQPRAARLTGGNGAV